MQLRLIIKYLVVFLFLVVMLFCWLYYDMQRAIDSPLHVESTQYLNVEPGMSLTRVAREIVSKGWISHPYYLILQARLYDKAHLIKAGEYEIEPGTTQIALLKKLVEGKVIQYSITIPEGLTFKDIISLIGRNKDLTHTVNNGTVSLLGKLDFLSTHPEGLFYPDTYHFPRGTTDMDIFSRSYQMMQEVLLKEWKVRAMGLPYQTPYEALIMASIIEKETSRGSERSKISGVFLRRLQIGMRLQTDPTVIYALAESFDGNIRRKDLSVDSPYNTYLYAGLPPTPIASPGRASIEAALQPAEGEDLYFVAKGDGTHQFSSTLEEHNNAVRLYQLNNGNSQ